jgi:hypothetical protein
MVVIVTFYLFRAAYVEKQKTIDSFSMSLKSGCFANRFTTQKQRRRGKARISGIYGLHRQIMKICDGRGCIENGALIDNAAQMYYHRVIPMSGISFRFPV